jgi:hypothetical protein
MRQVEQVERLVGVEDGEVGGQADVLGVAEEHPATEGVDGAEP